MEIALCNANPNSKSEKKASKKLNESNGFHENGNLQCAKRTVSMKSAEMEEPSVNVISDLLQVETLSPEVPKRKRKKKSSAPIISVGTSLVETSMPIVDPTLHLHVAEVSEPLAEGNSIKANSESAEPIAGLSSSKKKRGKPKKRCKSPDGNDTCDGTSPKEDILSGIDPSQQPQVSEFSEKELDLPQPIREGISATSSEDPRPGADLSCDPLIEAVCTKTKKKRKPQNKCKPCESTSPVVDIIPGIDPSQQPPVSEFSEQEQECPHPMEGMSIISSEDPKPSADLSFSQEKKKRHGKKRHKTNESCGKDKIYDLCVGTSLVDNVTPGTDPIQQAVVSEISKQNLELPQTIMEGVRPTSSEGANPDADLSGLQEKKKKNQKRRRKTHESNVESCGDDKTCERNDESCGEDKRCNLSLGTSVENLVSEFPRPAVEGISPTSSECPNPDADLSCLQEKKKKNRKRKRKTHGSNDESCGKETDERNDESCGEDTRCNISHGTSVENIIPGLDPSQQPPVSEFSEQMQDLPHSAGGGICRRSSEAPKPSEDLSCSQKKKKKNRKKRSKTNVRIKDGKDKRCDTSSVENIMPPSERPLVSEFLEQELEFSQPLRVGISTKSSEGATPDEDKTELTDKKVKVSSLPLLAVKSDVDVAVIEEAKRSEISNYAGERSLASCSKKKLLILDVNGLLADIVSQEHVVKPRYKPDITISRKAVFKRPACDEFLEFCFDKFNVGVWSSRTRKNVDMVIDFLFGDSRSKLLFCWDQSHCTTTRFKTLDNKDKPIVLKELRKLWEKLDPDLPWMKGEYNESNTILLDDSPYKALRNPVNTAIFPDSYHYNKRFDNGLGASSRLRKYLTSLADADNVQKYVEEHPFGQQAITETDASWGFYRKVRG